MAARQPNMRPLHRRPTNISKFDEASGFVVAANTEVEARKFVNDNLVTRSEVSSWALKSPIPSAMARSNILNDG